MEKDYEFFSVWSHALTAINRVNRERWNREIDTFVRGPHYWHLLVVDTYELHPLIMRIIRRDCIRPVDWHLLLLEWPHVSEDNDQMIAYTRSEQAGQAFVDEGSKRLTKTTIGKYLARHWPHVRDDIRRDWAGRHAPAKYEIWDTIEGIISGVELGPQSCMKSSYGTIPFNARDNEVLCAWHSDKSSSEPRWDKHPYTVYQPEFGWRMAVRLDAGKPDIVMGRCLVNVRNGKYYVRSYKRGESDGDYSHTDEKLERWLDDQGFEQADGWDGYKIARTQHPDDGIMVPYIDGRPQSADVCGDHLMICENGDLEGDNTDGRGGSERESMGDCECCGSTVYEDDDERIWAERDEDTLVGGCCAGRFTFVRGATDHLRCGYSEYYVRDDDAVRVRGQAYDKDNLPDCIKELHDGEKVHEDEAVYLEEEDAYYRCGDDDIVEVDGECYLKSSDTVVECRDGEYRKRDECWEDNETSHWYDDNTDFHEIAGEKYHSDTLKQWLLDAGQMNLDLEY